MIFEELSPVDEFPSSSASLSQNPCPECREVIAECAANPVGIIPKSLVDIIMGSYVWIIGIKKTCVVLSPDYFFSCNTSLS